MVLGPGNRRSCTDSHVTAGPEDCSRADGCEGRAGCASAAGARISRGKQPVWKVLTRTFEHMILSGMYGGTYC